MSKIDRKNNPMYQAKVIEEFFDPNKLLLICKDHMYSGGGMIPKEGEHCKKCHLAFWQVLAASFPPEKREELIAQLHEAAFKLVEEIEKHGGLDINLYPHAKFQVEKSVDS